MPKVALTAKDDARIKRAVAHFADRRHLFEQLAQSVVLQFQLSPKLSPLIHFIKHRIKSCESLREKLIRKTLEQKASGLNKPIDESNLFEQVTDLAGIRLIHLHTAQLREIHPCILDILHEQKFSLIEEPTANCWDIEYAQLFSGYGIKAKSRDSMYTTIHYVVEANQRTKITCEVQVRTLMDEVWGEVSHRVNYPAESPSIACRDQLKVLARMTSGCTRLVDSIFQCHIAACDAMKE